MEVNIANLNRKTKQIAKHLDIKLCIQDEQVETVFERFSAYSFEDTDFVLYSAALSKRYQLHYDFKKGVLTYSMSGEETEITDLISSRHLRSILCAAHEVLYLSTTPNINPLTKKIHKEHPQPVIYLDNNSDKRYFLVDSVEFQSDNVIFMTGLLSIDRYNVYQPTKAECKIVINRSCFFFKYYQDGKKVSATNSEHYYSFANLKIRDILQAFSEIRVANSRKSEDDSDDQILRKKVLDIFKNEQINLFTKNKPKWSMTINFIAALISDIKSVTDTEIVLLACDGNTLSKEIIFNRIDRKIYADMPGIGSKLRQEMFFPPAYADDEAKFMKAIRIIERSYK